jgi:Beta-galactosidase trimerisation domain/Polysaccharide deacetylase
MWRSHSSLLRDGFLAIALFSCVIAQALAGQTYLYRSEATLKYFQSASGDYSKVLDAWRGFAIRESISLKEIDRPLLKSLKRDDVLVLPSVMLMTDAEKSAIDEFVARGGALLATWATGGRDQKGDWLGYQWLKRMLDIDIVADIRQDSEERFLLPYGENLASSQLPAGKRMYLLKTAEPLLRAKAKYSLARYGDWTRSTHTPFASTSAITANDIKGARRVWIGATEASWAGAQADMDKVLKDLLAWLHRQPTVSLASWPAPFQTAFFVEMDTEDKFENAAVLEKIFDDRGLRGSFYVLTSLALKHPELVKRLAVKHDVGFHADIHTGFKGLSSEQQDFRVRKMMADLKQIIGDTHQAIGFRAPLESYDKSTEIALRARGLRLHVADPGSSDSSLPVFSSSEPGLTSDQALLVTPRTLLDDINYQQMGILKPGSVKQVLLENLQDKLMNRGLGLLSVHSQNFASDSVLAKEVATLLDEALRLRNKVWLPSGDQIDAWWRGRARVQLSSTRMTGGQIAISVANTGAVDMPSTQLIVSAPNFASKLVISPLLPGLQITRQDDLRWAISLPILKGGTFTKFSAKFVN